MTERIVLKPIRYPNQIGSIYFIAAFFRIIRAMEETAPADRHPDPIARLGFRHRVVREAAFRARSVRL